MKLRTTFAIFASAIVFSGTTLAQKDYRGSDDYIDGVTIYEHCGFKGKRQTLRPGEYPSLRDIGFGNDSVSSIRVPRGSEAVIYRDDDYRGPFARIDRDIRCFDRKWNDEASSISVRETSYRDDRSSESYRNNDRSNSSRDYDRRDNSDRRNTYDRGSAANNRNQGQANVTAKNISQVIFDGISLQQVSTTQWSMDSNRGASKQFQEVRRDSDSVYLENKYTAERVRIDLFANDVTFVDRDGSRQRYNIDRKNAALESKPNRSTATVKPVRPASPDPRIRANCFNYKAYTKGGAGGIRFYGKDGFYQFATKGKTGRVCHKGELTMEINKTNLKTDVIVEIDGKRFRFAPNEKEDRLLNTWYRKKVVLKVGL